MTCMTSWPDEYLDISKCLSFIRFAMEYRRLNVKGSASRNIFSSGGFYKNYPPSQFIVLLYNASLNSDSNLQ